MSEQPVQFENIMANPELSGVQDVPPEEVHKHLDQLVLIDVRQPKEYTGELGHIKGSQLLTLDSLPQRIQELPKNKPIVFVCRSGGRSARASAFALEQGFSTIYNLFGGMLLWTEKNFPVVKSLEY